MLRLFDVIWIFDPNTRPQKRKMYLCLSYEDGWYLRINTKPYPKPSVAIPKETNPFLHHDSHVECALLEVDEFEIDEAVREGGVYGRVSLAHKAAIAAALIGAPYVRPRDKVRITELLGD